MTTWYQDPAFRGQQAYSVRPDLWPPGTNVRLDNLGPFQTHGLADWARWGYDVTRAGDLLAELDRSPHADPGAAEALVLADRVYMGTPCPRYWTWVVVTFQYIMDHPDDP